MNTKLLSLQISIIVTFWIQKTSKHRRQLIEKNPYSWVSPWAKINSRLKLHVVNEGRKSYQTIICCLPRAMNWRRWKTFPRHMGIVRLHIERSAGHPYESLEKRLTLVIDLASHNRWWINMQEGSWGKTLYIYVRGKKWVHRYSVQPELTS